MVGLALFKRSSEGKPSELLENDDKSRMGNKFRCNYFLRYFLLSIFVFFFAFLEAAPGDLPTNQSKQSETLSPLLKLPSTSSDADKLRFLLAIKEQVPKLFSDAAKYDVDLFSLLDANQNLLKQLIGNPDYIREFAKRKNLSEAKISPPSSGASIVLPNTNQDATLAQWKAGLIDIIEKPKNAAKFSDEISALSASAKKRGRLPVTSEGALGAFMSILERDKSPAANRLKEMLKSDKFKTGTFEQKIAFIQKNIRDIGSSVMADFNSERAGFEVGDRPIKTYKDLADSLSQIVELDKLPLSESIQLAAVLKDKGIKLSDSTRARSEIEKLKWSDFERYHDKQDVLIPSAKAMGLTDAEALTIGSVVKHRQDLLIKRNTATESVAVRALKISEVPPYVGIFRGCASGDCSTQYSFPYPNDPFERVFFIYPENSSEPKGIVSSTIVEAGGKKSLYVITLQGNLSGADTITVLHGLEKIKSQLGVDQIVLPLSNHGLINNPTVATIVDREAKRGKQVEIKYQHPEIRKIIQDAPNHNSGAYDHMDKNTTGRVFIPRKEVVGKLNVEFNPKPLPVVKLPSLTKSNTLYFALDMHASNREDDAKRVIALGEHSPGNFGSLTIAIKNELKKPVAQYLEYATSIARLMCGSHFNEAEFKSMDHIFYLGRIRAPDALTGDNFKESMRQIRADVRAALQGDGYPDIGWEYLESSKAALAKDPAWNKMLTSRLLEQLVAGKNIWDGQNKHVLNLLEPTLSQEFYKTHFSAEKVTAFIKSPNSNLLVLADKGSGIIHAQPHILPTLLHEAVARGDILAIAEMLERYPQELKKQIQVKNLGSQIVQGIAIYSSDAGPGALNHLVDSLYLSKLDVIYPQVLPGIVNSATSRGDIQALSNIVYRYLLIGESMPSWLAKKISPAIVQALHNPQSNLTQVMPSPWIRIFETYPEVRDAYLKAACARGSLATLSLFRNYFGKSPADPADDKAIKAAAGAVIKAAREGDKVLTTGAELFHAYPSLIMPYLHRIAEGNWLWDSYEELFKTHGDAIKAYPGLSRALKQAVLAKMKNRAKYPDAEAVLDFLNTSIASLDTSLQADFEKYFTEAIKAEAIKAAKHEKKFVETAQELPHHVAVVLKSEKTPASYRKVLTRAMYTMNPENLLYSFLRNPSDFTPLDQAKTLAQAINAGAMLDHPRNGKGNYEILIRNWEKNGQIGAIQTLLETLRDSWPKHSNFSETVDRISDIIVKHENLFSAVLAGHSRMRTGTSLVKLARESNVDQKRRIGSILDNFNPRAEEFGDLHHLADKNLMRSEVSPLLKEAASLSPKYLKKSLHAAALIGDIDSIEEIARAKVISDEEFSPIRDSALEVLGNKADVYTILRKIQYKEIITPIEKDSLLSGLSKSAHEGELWWTIKGNNIDVPEFMKKHGLLDKWESLSRIALESAIKLGHIHDHRNGGFVNLNDGADLFIRHSDTIFKALESSDPKIHENLAPVFNECWECKNHFEKELFQSGKWKKALVSAAKSGKINFVNDRIQAAGVEIPDHIKRISNSREARRALTSAAIRGETSASCSQLLKLLYLNSRK